MNIKRTLLAGMLAASIVLPALLPGNASAAIPCQTNPLIPTPDDMPMTLILLEYPLSPGYVLQSTDPADRDGSIPLQRGDHATPTTVNGQSVMMAAANQFRCLGYGQSEQFAINSTPFFRARSMNVAQPEANADYVDVGSGVFIHQIGNPIQLQDGRYLVDFSVIVDGSNYLAGELVFADENGTLYLDDSYLTTDAELEGEKITEKISERFTREVKIIETSNGDRIVFDNQGESVAYITIIDPDGDQIFRGFSAPKMFVGDQPRNVFVVYGLEAGEYEANITFENEGISYNITISVAD